MENLNALKASALDKAPAGNLDLITTALGELLDEVDFIKPLWSGVIVGETIGEEVGYVSDDFASILEMQPVGTVSPDNTLTGGVISMITWGRGTDPDTYKVEVYVEGTLSDNFVKGVVLDGIICEDEGTYESSPFNGVRLHIWRFTYPAESQVPLAAASVNVELI